MTGRPAQARGSSETPESRAARTARSTWSPCRARCRTAASARGAGRNPPRGILGRQGDREGEEAEALPARDLVARGAGRGHPQGRVWLLERLRQHAPRRDAEVRSLPGEHVGGPRADYHVERLLPQAARLVRVDAEALELVARPGAAGTGLEAALAPPVEPGGHPRT